MRTTNVGTHGFVAPEINNQIRKTYTEGVDIFSLGSVVIYIIIKKLFTPKDYLTL